jgi:hypothetical protein
MPSTGERDATAGHPTSEAPKEAHAQEGRLTTDAAVRTQPPGLRELSLRGEHQSTIRAPGGDVGISLR